MKTSELVSYLDNFLDAKSFKDASLNGLQVAGREETFSLAVACTASLNAIEAAVNDGCDTLLVHHGLIWRGQQQPYAGSLKERLQALFDADMNLIAYHLPLDANMELGNNKRLIEICGAQNARFIEDGVPQSIAMFADFSAPTSAGVIAKRLAAGLDNRIRVIAAPFEQKISRVAVCSGSGSFLLDENPEPAFDALITGDCDEQTWHLANERGIAVFVTGHDASENPGIASLGEMVSDKFGLELLTIEENPELCDEFFDVEGDEASLDELKNEEYDG